MPASCPCILICFLEEVAQLRLNMVSATCTKDGIETVLTVRIRASHWLTQKHCLCSVTIKGRPNEEAVLCTRKGTYAVKHVDTTNSLFLIPPAKEDSTDKVTVAATAAAHLELVLTAPRFGALDRILQVRDSHP